MEESFSENFEVELEVNEIIWGNTKIDVINGFDNIAYSTLKLRCNTYTVMIFKNNFKHFQDVKIGFKFKAVISLWKNNTYNFIRLIEDHPKLFLAKKEYKIGNYSNSKALYEDYFKTCFFSVNKNLPIGIFTDCKMYFDTLIYHYNLNISNSNPYYHKFEQALDKCYDLTADSTYTLKEDVELIRSINYFHSLMFGKYKDEKVIDILKKDPQYLFSLIIDTNHFCLTEVCFIINDFSLVPNYLEALEINSIKLLLEEERCKSELDVDDLRESSSDFAGFGSWEELSFGQAFEGDIDAWNSNFE